MSERADLRLPRGITRRMLTCDEAAAYCGPEDADLLAAVKPTRIGAVLRWDRRILDLRYDIAAGFFAQTVPDRAVVYFVQGPPGTPIKIGFVTAESNLASRIAALQTGYPYKLRVLCLIEGTRQDERAIHAALSFHRMQGEWFRHCPVVHQLIRDINAGRALPGSLARAKKLDG